MTDSAGDSVDRLPDETTLPGVTQTGLFKLMGGLDRLELLSRLPDRSDCQDVDTVLVARYRAGWRIGAGRFGQVYAAVDMDLGRMVVLKVPQPLVLTDPALRERFLREARAAARLDHPGIVAILDAGVDNGLPYLVASLVDGPTLAEWLANRGVSSDPRIAAELMARLAIAVQHAHERGVLHCDLKPANVLLDRPETGDPGVPEAGIPRVTDFGLARMLEDDPALTKTLQVAGTPLYMAPEQARGDRRHLTARADVYSLGAMLYELLAGRPPFVGDSAAEIMSRLIGESVTAPHRFNPRIPLDLEAVCLRCLEKQPEDRYPTAAALADDLTHYLRGEPTVARPVGPIVHGWRYARRHPAFAGLVAVAVLAVSAVPAVAIWYSARLQTESDARRIAETEADAGEFVAILERVRQRRQDQPTGWAKANLSDIRLAARLPLAERHAAELRTEAAIAISAFDPAPPRVLAPDFNAYAAAFSSNGKLIALGSWLPDGANICTVKMLDSETGNELRELTYSADLKWEARRGKSNTDGCRSVIFSPDGRWLVLGTRSGRLIRWDLDSRDPQPVQQWSHAAPYESERDERVNCLAFTASGKLLVSSDGRSVALWAASGDWKEVAAIRNEPVAELARPACVGDQLYVRTNNTLYTIAEEPPHFLKQIDGSVGGLPATAPGGDLIVGQVMNGDTLYPTDTKNGLRYPALNLPNDNKSEDDEITDVLFSPDGSLLATSAEHIGHLKVWSVSTGRPMAAWTPSRGSLRLSFAPNGRSLLVCTENGALLYDLPTPDGYSDIALQTHPIVNASVSSPGDVVVTNSMIGHEMVEQAVWAAAEVDRQRSLTGRFTSPMAMSHNSQLAALTSDGKTLAYSTGNDVRVRSATSREGVDRLLNVNGSNLKDLRFGSDRRLWMVVKAGVYVWLGDDKPLRLHVHPDATGEVVYQYVAPGRTVALAGCTDGSIERLEPDGPGPAPSYPGMATETTALALSADELIAIAGDAGGGVKVFEVATGKVVADVPYAHRNAVQSVALAPGGWFVTGSRDRSVKLWNSAGQLVLTLPQTRPVLRVFVSDDARILTILVQGERSLKRWRLDKLQTEFEALGLKPGMP